MKDPKFQQGPEDKKGIRGSPGIRAPLPGESSSSGVPLQSDAPSADTFLDIHSDPGNTPLDANATFLGEASTPARHLGRLRQNVRLQPGDLIGGRYEILDLLGEGGMGAVYKASDREVNRFVALKLIRPDLASDPEILSRFKQELLTAHQVTHKNVIRIYDLSEADGVKFITMEFIEGVDLRRLLLDQGKFSPEQVVELIRQVCLALDAAHSVGVIHRDLKPQNIMRDKSGRILVMDFGLARSLDTGGMTQTGALLGTLEYMSPEQAMGKPLDQRSDLFAIGLIFYELLTNNMPFKADTAMASLLRRNQERATPAADLDTSIPKGLSDIVSKCLERDVNQRYQTAQEILADLDAWKGSRPVMASIAGTLPAVRPALPWKWLAAVPLALAVSIGGWVLLGKYKTTSNPGAAAGPEVSLAILPFRNATTDLSMDWIGSSLADMLSTDVGQSAHVRIVSSDRLRQILKDLRVPPNAAIDPDTYKRIAELSNADTVVSGQYAKFGDQIQIDATMQDLKHNRPSTPLKIKAAGEKEIPATVDSLAEMIRKNLSLSSDVLKELKASSFQTSTKSVPALKQYNQGVQLLRDGKTLDAAKAFTSAIQEDPKFALAYARLAQADSDLAHDNDAEQNSRKAVDLSQDLSLTERYLIQANHARIMKDTRKAIEAYENLAKTLPDNADVNFALGDLYLNQGDFDKARARYASILKNDPKNLNALLQSGWLEVRAGNPQASLDPLNRALNLSVELDNQEQKAQVLQTMGEAYKFLNKSDESLRNFQASMEINQKLGKKGGVANSLAEMANVQGSLGKTDSAMASFTKALDLDREIGAKKNAADTMVDMGVLFESKGQYDKALQLYKESLQMQRDLGDEANQALCLNNIGNVYLAQGKSDDALTYYQQSLQLRQKLGSPADIAQTLHNLGEGYLQTAQYENAMNSYLKALELRRKSGDPEGAGLESEGMGMVFLYQGRYGAAVKSLQDAVKAYEDAKDRSVTIAEILNSYARALTLAGRAKEASKPVEEAEAVVKEIKNESLQAEVFTTRGDIRFYSGDLNGAKIFYQQGQQSATRAKDQEKLLLAMLGVTKVAVAQGQNAQAAAALRRIITQADAAGLKYLSVDASVSLAETLVASKDYARAQSALENQMRLSDKLGLRMHLARIQFLQGELARLSGRASEAPEHYRQAVRILDEARKDPGAEQLLERPDLKQMFDTATRGANSAQN